MGKHITGTSAKAELYLHSEIAQLELKQLYLKRKTAHEQCRKRLVESCGMVAGRKLDQQISRSRKSGRVVARGRTGEREIDQQKLELFKNFKFNFSKQTSNIKNLLCAQSNAGLDIDRLTQALKQIQIKAASKEKAESKDKYIYFVLDTNVLIDSLHLLEDVSRLKLDGTSGSRLYVPYMVIKELDTLKGRQTTRFAAHRAIEYLNNMFFGQRQIEAQSALAEVQHLIDVDSPDDSIINCCLQLKSSRKSMMLLTNDNNMRLKAFASSIQVSTCYQLVSCQGHSWSRRLKQRQRKRVPKSFI